MVHWMCCIGGRVCLLPFNFFFLSVVYSLVGRVSSRNFSFLLSCGLGESPRTMWQRVPAVKVTF